MNAITSNFILYNYYVLYDLNLSKLVLFRKSHLKVTKKLLIYKKLLK